MIIMTVLQNFLITTLFLFEIKVSSWTHQSEIDHSAYNFSQEFTTNFIDDLSNRHLSFMKPEAQNNSQVIAQLGGKAVLSCYTIFLGDQLVIWLKRDEERLLTVGKQVYSSEGRYSIAHVRHQNLWELTVREVGPTDQGLYECQLTSHPPISLFFWLKIVEARAVIQGRKEIFIREGTSLEIFCQVEGSTERTLFVFWFHNGSMINYKAREDIQISKKHSASILTINHVAFRDSGIYTCDPYLSKTDNVTIRVVKGSSGYIGRPFVNRASKDMKIMRFLNIICLIVLLHLFIININNIDC